jgi:Flp pilus assembly protein TadD
LAETVAFAEFKRGVELLRNGFANEAMEYLHRAAQGEKQNPYYLSFLGVSVARARKKWSAALELCEAALRLKPNEAQFHLNLAEVYVSAGRREDAVEVLDSALEQFRLNTRIKRERGKLGTRENPVLPFLARQHFLNRNLGRLRHRALVRLQKAKQR